MVEIIEFEKTWVVQICAKCMEQVTECTKCGEPILHQDTIYCAKSEHRCTECI